MGGTTTRLPLKSSTTVQSAMLAICTELENADIKQLFINPRMVPHLTLILLLMIRLSAIQDRTQCHSRVEVSTLPGRVNIDVRRSKNRRVRKLAGKMSLVNLITTGGIWNLSYRNQKYLSYPKSIQKIRNGHSIQTMT